jgi:hypothetical protein
MEPTQGAPEPGEAGDRPRAARAGDDPSDASSAPPPSEALGGEPAGEAPADSADSRNDEYERLRLEAAGLEETRQAERAALVHAAEAAGGRVRSGLMRWALIVFFGGVASLSTGRPDLALFLVLAAFFALTQSWDARDRALTGDTFADELLKPGGVGRALRLLVPMLLPALGAIGYGGFAAWAHSMSPSPAHTSAYQWGMGAAGICAVMMLPPVAQLLAAVLVRPPRNTYTARLTASLAMISLLLPIPVQLVWDEFRPLFRLRTACSSTCSGLVSQLAGELLFALAAVGLWGSRGSRDAWARLGLGPMGPREWMVAVAGLVTLSGLNSSLEWVERAWLPGLWQQDQSMGEMITRDMGVGTALVLGLSAGVGEEVLVRGALQPRTGLLWASLLFAAAHVQYTWFGMLVIAMLGIALGLVRRYTNTTTAIVVHGVYDVIAAFGLTR